MSSNFNLRNVNGINVQPYTYTPLQGPNTIRVLELLPNQGYLECEIREIHYSVGGYYALSYVWGSPEKPFYAIVRNEDEDGVAGYIPLTTNLIHALHDLRACGKIEDKVFWIDQICINVRTVHICSCPSWRERLCRLEDSRKLTVPYFSKMIMLRRGHRLA